ncbi:MAG: hypothetical protein FJ100_00060 [Deltaproteobacteria bacterium]|nr:hypothetical protein [Deltaproteobacteria bacterium]
MHAGPPQLPSMVDGTTAVWQHATEPALPPARSNPPPASSGPPAHSGLGADFDALLRHPDRVLTRVAADDELAGLARAALATIAVAGAVFGGAVGAYYGGVQVVYAAVKLPLVLLATAAVSAPALTAFNCALGRPAQLRRDLALFLIALARMSLALVGAVPFLRLCELADVGYHAAVLATVTAYAGAGLVAVATLVRGLRSTARPGSSLAAVGLVTVFAIAAAQLAWTARPWLLRPRAPAPVFLRALEGDLGAALEGSADSARGEFRRGSAPLPSTVHGGDQ